ncbi:MAG: SCO family protein [Rhizobiaceae bacterium]
MKLPTIYLGKTGFLFALALGLGFGTIAAITSQPQAQSSSVQASYQVSESNTDGFPLVKSGDFDLIDNKGRPRTSKNPNGKYQLVFFGYANCKAMCSVALPNLANAVDLLAEMNIPVTPVLITVDPKRDTVAALDRAVADIHPNMVGLTGSEKKLEAAYNAFNLEKKFLFEHIDEGAIYSHGSFIYLLDPKGNFKTLFAPIISPVRIAEISAGYISQTQ